MRAGRVSIKPNWPAVHDAEVGTTNNRSKHGSPRNQGDNESVRDGVWTAVVVCARVHAIPPFIAITSSSPRRLLAAGVCVCLCAGNKFRVPFLLCFLLLAAVSFFLTLFHLFLSVLFSLRVRLTKVRKSGSAGRVVLVMVVVVVVEY